MNIKKLSYELGVMMYNVAVEQETSGYDLVGNFEGLVIAVSDDIDKHSLKEGFEAEKLNFDSYSTLSFEDIFEEFFA